MNMAILAPKKDIDELKSSLLNFIQKTEFTKLEKNVAKLADKESVDKLM